jgi:hypothetical protein
VRTAADSAAYAAIYGGTVRVGDVKYADVNGDGRITSDDQTVIGHTDPSWTWGLENTVRVGRLDASALVTAVRGNSVINTERMRYLNLDGTINVPTAYVRDAFDPVTNPNGRYPMPRSDRRNDARFSDLYVEDGSFIRLKNVQIGYSLPFRDGRSARLYVNGVNLLTHTKYTGFDPEVSAFGAGERAGVDQGSYPQQRLWQLGLSTAL